MKHVTYYLAPNGTEYHVDDCGLTVVTEDIKSTLVTDDNTEHALHSNEESCWCEDCHCSGCREAQPDLDWEADYI